MAYPDFLSKTRLQLILVLGLLCVGTFYYGSTELEVTDGALNAIVDHRWNKNIFMIIRVRPVKPRSRAWM